MKNIGVGEQLGSQRLYENQKVKLVSPSFIPGPQIISVGLKSPENIGGIFRLADAVGCRTLIFIHDGDDELISDKKISKIARNTNKIFDVVRITTRDFIESDHSYHPLIAIEMTTQSSSLFDVELPSECSFVVGNERHGISKEILDICDQAIHIPMFGINGSMNVSHALGICLFEWRRQTSAS